MHVPIRVRCLILLPVILIGGILPFLQATWACFWEQGFSRFIEQLEDEYSGWCKAVLALLAALWMGEPQ